MLPRRAGSFGSVLIGEGPLLQSQTFRLRALLCDVLSQRGGAMKRRAFVISTLAGAVGLATASRLAAQKKTIEPDLAALADGKGFQLFNRSVSRFTDGAKKGARLSEAPGEGIPADGSCANNELAANIMATAVAIAAPFAPVFMLSPFLMASMRLIAFGRSTTTLGRFK